MGREVRRVPADWQHPKDSAGRYIPLRGGSYAKAAARWDECFAKWSEGLRDDWNGGWKTREPDENYPYEDWDGPRPVASEYMPDWPDEQRTHLQMYEDCSEGTPISPVIETPEKLARWLADNGASAFGDMTATYEQWLATIRRGFAVSAMFSPETGLISGVAAETLLR